MLVFSGFCGGYGLLFWGCILDWDVGLVIV